MTDLHTPLPPLPEEFKGRVLSMYGSDGRHWLERLPSLRLTLLERWHLQDPQPHSQLSYNYLEFAHSPEYGPVALKIGFPNPELRTEIQALDLYQGRGGAVQLLDWDMDQGFLLMERILPGHDLTILSDEDQATRIAANAMLSLRQTRPPDGEFPTLADWCRAFNRYRRDYGELHGPLPGHLISRGSTMAEELLRSAEKQYLLHGDLHHGNLLLREDGSWVVIDPKGVIGDFAGEVGPYVYNPVPDLIQIPDLEDVLERRLIILGRITGINQHRLAAWTFCRAVLSAIWTVEDGSSHLPYWSAIAGILEKLLI